MTATGWEPRLRAVVAGYVARGEVPTPTKINRGMGVGEVDHINGRWTAVRTEMLRAAGYRLFRSPRYAHRWVPPGKPAPAGWTEVAP